MSWAACEYPSTGPAVLHMYPNLECWDGGVHSSYAALALVFLLAYVCSTSFVGIAFLETADPACEIRTTELFVITDRLAKVVIAGFAAFFFDEPRGQLVVTLCCVCALLVVTVWHRPCRDVALINLLRVTVYLFSIWSLISSLGRLTFTSI